MDRIVVRASEPLQGEVRVAGAKNSALKLMAACLLAPGTHVLDNVPGIADAVTMGQLLEALGASVQRTGPRQLTIEVPEELNHEAPSDLAERIRASVVLLGPLMGRRGRFRIALPGGDDFGGRPINYHLDGLAAMGAKVTQAGDWVEGASAGRLQGTQLTLEFASHTATDNLLMAAVLAEGETVIENAAREPEVVDLAAFLGAMGARISGAGTSRIVVEGVAALHPAHHEVVPDRVEAATYLAAVGMVGGDVRVLGGRAQDMRMLVEKLKSTGLQIEESPEGLRVVSEKRLRAVDVATLPYPGVATDYKPMIVSMLSVAEGVGIVTENLFLGGRFRYVDELRRMGADIWTEGHHAVIRGVPRLSGAHVVATDLRAGAALVLAGMVAEGETVVSGAQHIDRGYEDLPTKLASLGAPVSREPEGH